jgi:hypothetical protein
MGIGTRMAVAGALQGIGGAIVQQGLLADQERRALALEKLKQENQAAQTRTQYDLMDRNNANQTKRETDAGIIRDRNQGNIQAETDKRRFKQDLTLKTIDFNNDIEKSRFTAKSQIAMKALEQSLANGEVVETLEGNDGYVYARSRDGTTKRTDVQFAPKESSGGGTLAEVRNGRGNVGSGGGAPASPPPPAAKPTGQAPPKLGAVVDGYRYKGGDPSKPESWIKIK